MSEFLKVLKVSWYGPGIFGLELERNGTEFTVGDCVALFGEDQVSSRPYSVASGIDEKRLRFIIRRMAQGEVSDYLAGLKPGDRVKVSPPFGWFRPGDPGTDEPFVFVATGTGISPFLAHLHSHPERPPRQVIYGVGKLEDAVDLEWLRRQPFEFKLAVSREPVPGAHHGRVTDLLEEMPLDPAMHYYLCGLDAMIDEITSWLEHRDIPLTHIHRECFFNAEFE